MFIFCLKVGKVVLGTNREHLVLLGVLQNKFLHTLFKLIKYDNS